MIARLRVFLSRQTRFRAIMTVVGIASLVLVAATIVAIGYVSCCVTLGSGVGGMTPPITSGVDITQEVDARDGTNERTVTVMWTTDGTSDRLTVVADDTRKELTEIGQSARIHGVEQGDTIKILGTVASGRQGVTQIYTVE